MTASALLFYISVCLLGQITLGVLYAVFRKKPAPVSAADAHALGDAVTPSTAAWPGLRAFKVARREYEDAAQLQCSFYLEPVDGVPLPDFKPGQFLTFSLNVARPDGGEPRTLTRCYSLSDAPTASHYRITVKRVATPAQQAAQSDGGAGPASHYLHDHVQQGDVLQVRAPSGHFHIDASSQTAVVLIAGGIGITPMMSMAKWCLQHQPQRTVHLFVGVRNLQELAFSKVLKDMAAQAPQLHLHVVCSKPLPEDIAQQDFQHQGHIDIALLKAALPHGAHQFYLCGPSGLLESVVPALLQWGVPKADIHFEAFGPSSVRLPADTQQPVAAAGTAPLEICFAQSGRTLQWTGREGNLLEFAEQHGIAAQSGCRSGSCGSCVTTLTSGSVAYDTPPDYDLAANQCLLCVGIPRSNLVLEA